METDRDFGVHALRQMIGMVTQESFLLTEQSAKTSRETGRE